MKAQHGWVFDADGVLFDAHDPKVKIPQISEFLLSRLQKGEPVTINSGRGVRFALDKILPALQEVGVTPELLDHMLFVGQKGAEVGKFVDGEPVIEIDEGMRISDDLRGKVFELVRSEFAETMFEGEIKPTMISPQRRGIEQGKEVPLDEFHSEQERLITKLEQLLVAQGVQDKYKIDKTNIATDIENKEAGKGLGAQKIMEWMRQKGLFPQEFHTFGDSPSDQEMADAIHKAGYPVEFVWVGKRGAYDGKTLPYTLTVPDGIHDEATKNYFKSFEKIDN